MDQLQLVFSLASASSCIFSPMCTLNIVMHIILGQTSWQALPAVKRVMSLVVKAQTRCI